MGCGLWIGWFAFETSKRSTRPQGVKALEYRKKPDMVNTVGFFPGESFRCMLLWLLFSSVARIGRGSFLALHSENLVWLLEINPT